MDNSVRRTLRAFEALNSAQKKEVLDAVKGFEIKGKLDESVRKDLGVSMGPLQGVCIYCGK